MKKILALIISVFVLLSAFPANAEGERTQAVFANYNNVNEDFIITVISSDDTFQGATILIDNLVSYEISGDGAGSYTAAIDVSSLERACEVPIIITASYGGGDADVIEKTACFAKMTTTAKEYSYDDSAIRKSDRLNTESNTCLTVDENGVPDATGRAFSISFTRKCTDDIRVGYTASGVGAGTMHTLEFEAHFRNGDSMEKEKPAAYYGIAFRQLTSEFKDGYAYNSQTNEAADDAGTTLIFKENGTLTGTGEPYYTNTWYKVRCVQDIVTKDESGNLVGGLQIYIAEKDDESGEYGEYRLLKNHEYFTFKSVAQWRFYPRSTAAGGTLTIRNMNVFMDKPENTWYIDSTLYENDKINLQFSEDLGTIEIADIKVFNNIYVNEEGNIVPDEIKINKIENLGEGSYVITPSSALMAGKLYTVSFKNGMVSASGGKAFKEPAADENGDGFWIVASLKTPKHDLSIKETESNDSSVTVFFNNASAISGFASVCWYDTSNNMVDVSLKPVTVSNGGSQQFERSNNFDAEYYKVFVFEMSTEDENNGAVTTYDFQ